MKNFSQIFAFLNLSISTCATRLAEWRLARPQAFPAAKVCCAVLLMTAWAAGAATVSWVGGSGDWNTVTNWNTGALPGTNDDVVIGAGASITVTHSSGTHTVNSIQSQQAFVLSGGSLTVSNTVQVNNTFTFSGGTLAQATILQGTNGGSFVLNGSRIGPKLSE